MTKRQLTVRDVEAAVLGGKFLGGGGGGWTADGLALANEAMQTNAPMLISPDECGDDDIIVTAALVGAPAAKDQYVEPAHFVRTIERMESALGTKVAGVITNENGAAATVNGWIQAAKLGIPVIDAPCNGRAHPTGVMGSIGLHQLKDFVSIQAASGGRLDKYVEIVVKASLERAATLVRNASVQAGGVVAVARNPVTAGYVMQHGAVGAITQAIELGHAMLRAQAHGARAVVDAALDFMSGARIATGKVAHVSLRTEGGFDVGEVTIGDVDMTFWNEYMTLERNGERLATFPDLIMTMDTNTGMPLLTAELQPGLDVTVVCVPRAHVKLGAGMHDEALFKVVETVVNKEICKYVFAPSIGTAQTV
ncbi:DUF917 domain-containing protein [Alicyclobacillus acidiphilus]|uniref:DUF917 domain-containing protein n=1 Tax=Alicyclobacillus acidiphilus TaxID=182455 RepID=UPI000833A23D|nr:DUF917 family protein [Alicyclobacillus acidiphilus]